jgi:hypothetical protein
VPVKIWVDYWNSTLTKDFMTCFIKSRFRTDDKLFAELLNLFCCGRKDLKDLLSNPNFTENFKKIVTMQRRLAKQYLSKFRNDAQEYIPKEAKETLESLKSIKQSQSEHSTQSSKSKSQQSESLNIFQNKITMPIEKVFDSFSSRLSQDKNDQSNSSIRRSKRAIPTVNYCTSSTTAKTFTDMELIEEDDDGDDESSASKGHEDEEDEEEEEDEEDEEDASNVSREVSTLGSVQIENMKDYEKFETEKVETEKTESIECYESFLTKMEKLNIDEKNVMFYLYIIVNGCLIKFGCTTQQEKPLLVRYKVYYANFAFRMFPFNVEDLKNIPRNTWMHCLETYLFARIRESLPHLDKTSKLQFGSFTTEEEKASIATIKQCGMKFATDDMYVY